MYSEKISNQALDKVQKDLPFELTRYSVRESRDFVEYVNYLVNEDLYQSASKRGSRAVKNIIQDGTIFKSPDHKDVFYSEEVQQRIQNEALISKYDATYWMEHYYLVKDLSGEFVTYKPLPGQKVWAAIMADLNEQQLAIKLLDLKGRQQGDTTQKQGYVEHRLTFWPDTDCLIASKQEKDTDIMSRKILDSFNRQPFWLKPELVSFETGTSYRFDNGSFIDLGWGTQEYLGKGQSPRVCHISEIASFVYPKSALENALFRAMHEHFMLLQFLEGTAEARDDWFHQKVKEVIAGMERGTTAWYFNFVAWFFRRDLYPTEAYIRARSVAYANYIPKPETLAMARVAENSVKSWKYARQVLGANWRMDREQLFYYELERDQAEREDRLGEFLSQMPTTVDEAFQHAGKTLYKVQLITEHSNIAHSKIPEIYKLKGDASEVSPNYWPEPDEILPDGKTITIRCNWNRSIPASIFELVQVKFDGWDNFDPTNKFIIWEHPKKGFEYGQAIDTSDGLGRDVSNDAVINITRLGTPEFKDKQVMEFASPEIPLGSMWPFALVGLTYYSLEGQGSQILSTIECNKGFELQNALIQRGYLNQYKRLDESTPYQDESKVQKYGFWTDRSTRAALIGHFHTFFLGKHYEIYSPMLIGEVRDLQKVRKPNAELGFSGDKILGKKDNRVITAAINLFAIHRREIAGFEKKTWEERQRFEDNAVDIRTIAPLPWEVDLTEEAVLDEFLEIDDFHFDYENDEDFGVGSYS